MRGVLLLVTNSPFLRNTRFDAKTNPFKIAQRCISILVRVKLRPSCFMIALETQTVLPAIANALTVFNGVWVSCRCILYVKPLLELYICDDE
jgi:hypothetical protein